MYKLTVYIPETHLDSVKQALFEAGAGRYEQYDCCCWQVAGEGQFRPLDGSRPFLGQTGAIERVREYRVEMLCEPELAPTVTQALRQAHPYEEPAFDFCEIRTGFN
jgi:hypothetical protein